MHGASAFEKPVLDVSPTDWFGGSGIGSRAGEEGSDQHEQCLQTIRISMIQLGKQIIAAAGLLLFTASIIGCGSIATSVARSMVYDLESAQDRSFCRRAAQIEPEIFISSAIKAVCQGRRI